MTALNEIKITIHLRWWLILYLKTVFLFCVLLDLVPDEDRLMYWVMRGLYVKREK